MAMQRHEIEQHLDDHLPYERMMLEYTLQKITAGGSQCEWNVHYESFAVHARNLYYFLTNGDGTNAKAYEFVPGFKADRTATTIAIFPKLSAQVLHLSPSRPTEAEKKVQLDDAKKFHAWIVLNFSKFVEALSPELRSHWNEPRSKPPPIEASAYVVSTGPPGPNNTASVEVSPTSSAFSSSHMIVIGSSE
jgi:hypothetical protein